MRYRFARPKGTRAPTFQGSIEGEARRVQSMRRGSVTGAVITARPSIT